MPELSLRGARAHNLQDVDLDLPSSAWIAVTGPSGSGKTSLAFDVVHREGQRRYLGSLSAKARQVLGKLGAAEVDAVRGLPVTLATGQGALSPSPRSTVGTLVGLNDLLRLLAARTGRHPERLTRSHFSFNTVLGACPACKGLGVEDEVHPPLLIADPSRSIRAGALRPTLASGYTVYSQVTVEVMDTICRAHGFDVDTPWSDLSDAQRHVVLYGTDALVVPFGKHSLASRMKWVGITARPREEGHYRGLIPVIRETLKRDRNPNILRYVRSVSCTVCGGTRLGPIGRETRLGDLTLPALLAVPVGDLGQSLARLPDSPVLAALRPELAARLARLDQLALGHLSLDRGSATLSGGEGQRLRLAAQLNTQLGGMLLVLDEPTLGLHPSAQEGMAQVLEALRALGNGLLVVDHDPWMVQRSDHHVALGPGAGPHGGRVLHSGPVQPSALPVLACSTPSPPASPGTLRLRGAALHNLDGVDLDVPLRALTVVSGPSGAGKSSLVLGTLLPALEGRDGGPHAGLDGVPEGLAVRWVDARPIGRTPRSTPATYTGLFDRVRKRFAATAQARALGFGASRFSHNTKAGRCPTCEGLGVLRVGMHLLQDVEQTCGACGGGRFASEVLAVSLDGRHVAQVLALTVDEALAAFADDPPIQGICAALSELGLGYLHLGQSSSTLSRGEAQRIKLATLLGRPPRSGSLIVLDEPDRGLHPADVVRLVRCLSALIQQGHTVLAVSHHPMIWQAADHRFALRQGRAVTPCPVPSPASLAPKRPPGAGPDAIRLRGVRTHNLDGLDVDIVHGAITAITGVSGSGKSSLAFDTLAALSWARFAESLPFQVRRFVRQLPAPDLDCATGLTPVIAVRQGQGRPGPRATVGTQTRLDADLRLLWSRLGREGDAPTPLRAAQLSANHTEGACPACEGRGVVQRCDPARLVLHPERSLFDGALDGTRPGAFFGEPTGQYLATLEVAAAALGLDLAGPFASLEAAALDLALHGAGERQFSVTWHYQRGKRAGTHHFDGPWVGLCALVETEARIRARRADAADWSAPLLARPCSDCGGERLGSRARSVTVGGLRLPELSSRPLDALAQTLRGLEVPGGDRAVLDAVRPTVLRRLETLAGLGLGHLSLDRPSATLSTGERQRLRLAGVLDSELAGLTLVLDEPGTGLDEAALVQLAERLRIFCDSGNTVVLVSHRACLVAAADQVLTLGPGAGAQGGRLLAPPVETSPTAPVFLGEHGWLRIAGATAHSLRGFDLAVPDRGLVAISGPSGSGKSTLLFDVIGASAGAGHPRGCAAATGLAGFPRRHLTRATPVQPPLTSLGLAKAVQALFHGVGSGLPRSAFSFHSAAGRCPDCKGTGFERVSMDFMADLRLVCPTCEGQRFRSQVLAVRWRGLSVADLLAVPAATLASLPLPAPLARAAGALCRLGLSHVALGTPGHVLSGGEHQRVVLAGALASPDAGPGLYLLDEPGSGLHARDLDRLLGALGALAAQGACVLYTTHRQALIDGAHWQVALGPGGGEDGGRLVGSGRT